MNLKMKRCNSINEQPVDKVKPMSKGIFKIPSQLTMSKMKSVKVPFNQMLTRGQQEGFDYFSDKSMQITTLNL